MALLDGLWMWMWMMSVNDHMKLRQPIPGLGRAWFTLICKRCNTQLGSVPISLLPFPLPHNREAETGPEEDPAKP